MAEPVHLARKRNVHSLVFELELHKRFVERGPALIQRRFYIGAQLVCKLAHDGALLCGELAHLTQYAGQLALFAKIFDTQRFEKLHIVTLAYRLDGGISQPLHKFSHSGHS